MPLTTSPRKDPDLRQRCDAYRGFLLLQEKWVLFILDSLMAGPKGFNEISREAPRVNPTTLSQRLELLVTEGLVTKTVQSHMPPKTSYELTPAGKALKPILRSILVWGQRYLPPKSTDKPCPDNEN